MRKPQDNGRDEIDEHDQPTEPMPRINTLALSPSTLPSPHGEKASNNEIVPVPQPHERPFPQEYVSSTQVRQPPSQENASVPSPATPIKPTNQGERPAPVQSTYPKRANKKRSSPLPAFVGL